MNKEDIFMFAKAIAEANSHPTPDEFAALVVDKSMSPAAPVAVPADAPVADPVADEVVSPVEIA